MAKSVGNHFDEVRRTRVWRSIFRSGWGTSTLHRSLAIQQNVFLHLFSTKTRKRMMSFRATWYLGALTFGTFAILTITGILLMLYYHPSVPQAYADTKDLQFVVSSGMFLRNLHRWSAHAMVFLVFAHMFKVFYRGAYRPPREFNWVIGVILLLITLLLSYTGYLLPWDQLAYWAITVGSNIALAVPVVGNKVHFLLLGGNAVNANALLRFYVLHCVILPVAAATLVAIHFWRIRKDGGLYAHQSEPSRAASEITAAQGNAAQPTAKING
jgi:quinol-cytochrome oxidoreductase complex cytochrome b subunit